MQRAEETIVGIFVKELKNRFLCEVMIEGEATECYVPSSCRLENFLVLRGKQVLLLPTQTPNSRTRYSLLAVPYKRNYILLNTSKANKVIADNLHKRYFSSLGKRTAIFKEQLFGTYKSDLFLPDSRTLIEIKSVISLERVAVFPTVFSERTIHQLADISRLLDDGFKAALIITSLSPYVQQLLLDDTTPFFKALQPCLQKGLQLFAVALYISNGDIKIKKKIPIIY